MNWYCFKFWLVWRLVMASLAHFNWFTAIYMNCIYFTLWKSYDLLWFWSHLALCICFKPLRTENYLLVVCNLFMAKRKHYHNKTYQRIYNMLYNQRFTKSERVLHRIETMEGRLDGEQNLDDGNDEVSSSAVDENSSDFDLKDKTKTTMKFKSVSEFKADKEAEVVRTAKLYPPIGEIEEQAMPNIRVDRRVKLLPTQPRHPDRPEVEVPLVNVVNGDRHSEVTASTSSSAAHRIVDALSSKIVPRFVRRADTASTSDSLDAAEKVLVKARVKAEKRLQKEQQKEANACRKAELRKRARIERRRRNLAAAIDLLLTWLRLMTTFAILVGNIHQTFMPKYLIAPSQNIYDKPDLLMVFTITMSLDILLFWFMMFWTYCQQCRLRCQLGICRFWLWLITLSFLGGVCMYMPMHYIHQQLDMEWCSFMPGSDLKEYFDG